jgi:hypothetical protein
MGGRIISQGTLSIYKSKYKANNTSKTKNSGSIILALKVKISYIKLKNEIP